MSWKVLKALVHAALQVPGSCSDWYSRSLSQEQDQLLVHGSGCRSSLPLLSCLQFSSPDFLLNECHGVFIFSQVTPLSTLVADSLSAFPAAPLQCAPVDLPSSEDLQALCYKKVITNASEPH